MAATLRSTGCCSAPNAYRAIAFCLTTYFFWNYLRLHYWKWGQSPSVNSWELWQNFYRLDALAVAQTTSKHWRTAAVLLQPTYRWHLICRLNCSVDGSLTQNMQQNRLPDGLTIFLKTLNSLRNILPYHSWSLNITTYFLCQRSCTITCIYLLKIHPAMSEWLGFNSTSTQFMPPSVADRSLSDHVPVDGDLNGQGAENKKDCVNKRRRLHAG